jgi:hypothetical protein
MEPLMRLGVFLENRTVVVDGANRPVGGVLGSRMCQLRLRWRARISEGCEPKGTLEDGAFLRRPRPRPVLRGVVLSIGDYPGSMLSIVRHSGHFDRPDIL